MLKVTIKESTFQKKHFAIWTHKYKGIAGWNTHALTIQELEQVRDEICDFLDGHYKKEQVG